MPNARLNRVEVVGFRSYGQSAQSVDLPQTAAVIWGGNSQGKTSLAEAIEFLFSGQIARRELLASTKDEFAEAVRNVHIGQQCPTKVEAEILCPDGQVRRLSRTLIEDYRRGSAAGCISSLTIDGVVATDAEITSVMGVGLSHPPLVPPVLTQHTLAYVFSAPPNERSTYFRALLDTQDLEDFRVAVSVLPEAIPQPRHEYLDRFAELEKLPAIRSALAALRRAPDERETQTGLIAALKAMLQSVGATATGDLAADTEALRSELERRRSQSFPVALLRRGKAAALVQPTPEQLRRLDTFITERGRVDVETKKHTDLFAAALELHGHATEHAQDCSLCGTAGALTTERLRFIREQVAGAAGFKTVTSDAGQVLRAIQASAKAAFETVRQALPEFLRTPARKRAAAGFSVERIRELVGQDGLVQAWLDELWTLVSAVIPLARRYRRIIAECEAALGDQSAWAGPAVLRSLLDDTARREHRLASLEPAYLAAAGAMYTPLKAAVDLSIATEGWEALIACALSPTSTFEASKLASDHAALIKALKDAHGEIERANGVVADEKFADLSDDVREWWDRLRPDEPTFFDGVKRRSAKAKRTVDLRVGLAAKDDRSDAKFRDAVAVLSQSQLHCLGLSLFLARAVKEGAGFVVLDDPVLTSDDDYRPNFASSVVEALLDAGVQLVVATQDHKTWKEIGDRWGHRNVGQFLLVREDALAGTEIRNHTDDLAAMIARAQPFINSADPLVRKDGAARLRDAIERFGKMVVVRDRKAAGDNTASITDYDGQNFGNYSQKVYALLSEDPSHPGKLRTAHNLTTPGSHDDAPPSKGELRNALGDLKKLKKDYLG